MNKFFWNSVKEYRVKILLYTVLQFLRQGLGLLPPCFYLLFLDEIMTARKLELLGVVMGLYVAAFWPGQWSRSFPREFTIPSFPPCGKRGRGEFFKNTEAWI